MSRNNQHIKEVGAEYRRQFPEHAKAIETQLFILLSKKLSGQNLKAENLSASLGATHMANVIFWHICEHLNGTRSQAETSNLAIVLKTILNALEELKKTHDCQYTESGLELDLRLLSELYRNVAKNQESDEWPL